MHSMLTSLCMFSIVLFSFGCAKKQVAATPEIIQDEQLPISAAAAPQDDVYFAHRIFFGTDRETLHNDDIGTKRGRLTYGYADINIPFDYGRPILTNYRKVEIDRIITNMALDDIVKFSNTNIDKKRKCIVYIHGFNNSFKEAIQYTAQIAYNTKHDIDNIYVLYSWASLKNPILYAADEATTQWSGENFKRFIEEYINNIKANSIHFIAHSMGNRLLAEYFKDNHSSPIIKKIKTIIFAAADIDAQYFEERIYPHLAQIKKQNQSIKLKAYISKKDYALNLSKSIHSYPRLGNHDLGTLSIPDIEVIDVTSLMPNFGLREEQHGYIRENKTLIKDIDYTINSSEAQPNPALTKNTTSSGNNYWTLHD